MLCKAKGMVLQSASIIALEHHERFDGMAILLGKKEKIFIFLGEL
jgi:hypothetical protein